MEREYSDTLTIEMSGSELFEMVTALISRAEMFIDRRAPKAVVNLTISRAEKFNQILKGSGYDHWEDEKFMNLKARAV